MVDCNRLSGSEQLFCYLSEEVEQMGCQDAGPAPKAPDAYKAGIKTPTLDATDAATLKKLLDRFCNNEKYKGQKKISLNDEVRRDLNAAFKFGFNIASLATVTASSTYKGYSADAIKDGVVDGYRDTGPSDPSKEWASDGEKRGAWIKLTWDKPQRVDQIRLYDRPGLNDHIISGTLELSDGTKMRVRELPNDAHGYFYVRFDPKTITWVKFTVDQTSKKTFAVGLAEIEVYRAPSNAASATSSSGCITPKDFATKPECNEGDAEFFRKRADELYKLKRYNEATVAIQKAISINGNNAEYHNLLGNIFYDYGKYEEAAVEYKKAIRLDDKYAVYHYNLGNVLRKTGDKAGAIDQFKRALGIKPDYVEAKQALDALLRGSSTTAICITPKDFATKPECQ